MKHANRFIGCALGAAMLAACASTPSAGPVEVTRFHDASALASVGTGTVFVETAPGDENTALAIGVYKTEVLGELVALGYRETSRDEADHIAQVGVEQFVVGANTGNSGPVSVGVGGSTGSYGSGVGVGIGINLGGGRPKERSGTQLSVVIREAQTNQSIWEGRAALEVERGSPFEVPAVNADAIASALFREFPGNDGETVEVKVGE